jgi:hypothetical protein
MNPAGSGHPLETGWATKKWLGFDFSVLRMNEQKGNEPCGKCGHLFIPHVLVAYDDPLAGGLIFCPECDCVATWGVHGHQCSKELPPPHVIAEWRAAALGS